MSMAQRSASDDNESDDSCLGEHFLYNQFEIASVPRYTAVFECLPCDQPQAERHVYATLALTPLQALQAHLRDYYWDGAKSLTLRVCATAYALNIFDLDPLQYTRAYSADRLAVYLGTSGKTQRERVLAELADDLALSARKRRIELDALADLSRTADYGFQWGIRECLEEITEFYPLVAGLHYCPRPFVDLFEQRLVRVVRRRAYLFEHGTIELTPTMITTLCSAPLNQVAAVRQWPLTPPDDVAAAAHFHAFPAPTGYTSLNDTGRTLATTLRNTLLERAQLRSPAHLSAEQVSVYQTILGRCAALADTTATMTAVN